MVFFLHFHIFFFLIFLLLLGGLVKNMMECDFVGIPFVVKCIVSLSFFLSFSSLFLYFLFFSSLFPSSISLIIRAIQGMAGKSLFCPNTLLLFLKIFYWKVKFGAFLIFHYCFDCGFFVNSIRFGREAFSNIHQLVNSTANVKWDTLR